MHKSNKNAKISLLMKEFDRLVAVVSRLRKACPWDRAQTHETLKPYMVEEIYEALEAIDSQDFEKLSEELGDLLLHILMHAEMARQKKHFTIKDVIRAITAKMIRRHPHVFGREKDKKIAAIWERWEEIKKAEAGEAHKGILETIPQSLPALYRADKVQKRAARVGFDWDVIAGAWEKVYEELEEIKEILESGKLKVENRKWKVESRKLREEIGDLLFAVVNVARKANLDAEEALQQSTSKFMRRFKNIEEHAHKKGVKLSQLGLKQMDKIWEEAKKNEH